MSPYAGRKSVPAESWIPDKLWGEIIRSIPLVCVDIIFQRKDHSILLGWRIIEPYGNVWALPGGRMLYREDLRNAAQRIARAYGLRFGNLYLVGVFPVSFRNRSDVSVALAATHPSGTPTPDGFEFTKFKWTKTVPRRSGANYRRMISKWKQARKSREFLKLNRISPHVSNRTQ